MSMAKLNTVKKSRKEVKCEKCGVVLPPGSPYVSWKFRYGGTHYRCENHRPAYWERESNSKRQDLIRAGDAFANAQSADSAEEASGYLLEARDYVEGVKDALQESVDAWMDTNLQFSYRYESYESAISEMEDWISNVEDAASELESWEPEAVDPADVDEDDDGVDESWREIVDNLDEIPDVEL
jgi:hypothetical protein